MDVDRADGREQRRVLLDREEANRIGNESGIVKDVERLDYAKLS